MRKNLISVMFVIFLAGCNNSSQISASKTDSSQMVYSQTTIDTVKARHELNAMADEVHSSIKKKEVGFIDKYMTTDGIYIGTDPGEIWSFNTFKSNMESQYKDTAMKISDYPITRRDIVLHGASAIIVDQFMIPEMTNKIMIRNISHARYENGKWMFDLYSWNLIPKNEDIPKINKAL